MFMLLFLSFYSTIFNNQYMSGSSRNKYLPHVTRSCESCFHSLFFGSPKLHCESQSSGHVCSQDVCITSPLLTSPNIPDALNSQMTVRLVMGIHQLTKYRLTYVPIALCAPVKVSSMPSIVFPISVSSVVLGIVLKQPKCTLYCIFCQSLRWYIHHIATQLYGG